MLGRRLSRDVQNGNSDWLIFILALHYFCLVHGPKLNAVVNCQCQDKSNDVITAEVIVLCRCPFLLTQQTEKLKRRIEERTKQGAGAEGSTSTCISFTSAHCTILDWTEQTPAAPVSVFAGDSENYLVIEIVKACGYLYE